MISERQNYSKAEQRRGISNYFSGFSAYVSATWVTCRLKTETRISMIRKV